MGITTPNEKDPRYDTTFITWFEGNMTGHIDDYSSDFITNMWIAFNEGRAYEKLSVTAWEGMVKDCNTKMGDIIGMEPSKIGLQPCLYIIEKLLNEFFDYLGDPESVKSRVDELYQEWNDQQN